MGRRRKTWKEELWDDLWREIVRFLLRRKK